MKIERFANLEIQRVQWKKSGGEEGREMRVRKYNVQSLTEVKSGSWR